MTQLRRLALLPALLLVLFYPAFSHAQTYNTIVVFGDSLSDTGNDAHVFNAKYGFRFPGTIFDYTDGRFTDGIDTFPSTQNYNGVWIEQLAAMLPSRPVVMASLDGGNDYAYGFATTGGGSTVFDLPFPYNSYSFNIDNTSQQITHYLATHPKIDKKTLFVVWSGAIDVLYATSPQDVVNAAVTQAGNVERLIEAGATQFIVANLPPLGAVPRLNGLGPTATAATQASLLYNDYLAQGLTIVNASNPGKHLRLFPLDIFTLFSNVIAAPSSYSLTNVTASSQGFSVDPNTYLFWDDIHPTTRGHNIVAVAADDLIVHHQCLADPVPNEDGQGDQSDCKYVPAGGGGHQRH